MSLLLYRFQIVFKFLKLPVPIPNIKLVIVEISGAKIRTSMDIILSKYSKNIIFFENIILKLLFSRV
tara:strand:+ start:176 stop:376 length:201 start_codon:yes stop_codon:yes gene_type:complete